MPSPSRTTWPRSSASRIGAVRGGLGITSATTAPAGRPARSSRASGSPQPDRGGIDDDRDVVGQPRGAVPHQQVGGRRGVRAQERHEFLAATRVAVDHREVRGARQRRLDGDRPGRAARAEQRDRPAARVGHGAQRREEALAVGVLADQLAVAVHDAVDRADDRGGRPEPIEVRDHGHLVRKRTVEARPPHRDRAAHGVAEPVGGHVAVEVARVDAVVAVGGLDHRHRRVVARGGGERAGDRAEEGGACGHSRSVWVPCGVRWTSPWRCGCAGARRCRRAPGRSPARAGGATRSAGRRHRTAAPRRSRATGSGLRVSTRRCAPAGGLTGPETAAAAARELVGWNLACYCPLDGGPCHRDVLLAIARAPLSRRGRAGCRSAVRDIVWRAWPLKPISRSPPPPRSAGRCGACATAPPSTSPRPPSCSPPAANSSTSCSTRRPASATPGSSTQAGRAWSPTPARCSSRSPGCAATAATTARSPPCRTGCPPRSWSATRCWRSPGRARRRAARKRCSRSVTARRSAGPPPASGSRPAATTPHWSTCAPAPSRCWRRPGCCRTSTPAS